MSKYNIVLVLLLVLLEAAAQPYLDVAAVRYHGSPDAGILRRQFNSNQYQYASTGVNLPIVFKDSAVLMVSPTLEWWNIKSKVLPQLPHHLYGMALPIAYVKPFNNKWTGTFMAVQRWNGAGHFGFKDRYQLGSVVLLSCKQSQKLTYKFGLYYNREAFGNFIMPLAGIDWRPLPKLRVFGVLPGHMVLEKNVSKAFYYGVSFRATTTSYRFPSKLDNASDFVRIEDNTLQAFADLYLTKNVVLNAEGGHSLFRRLRLGQQGSEQKYFMQEKFNDGFLFRLSLLYRVRFDGVK